MTATGGDGRLVFLTGATGFIGGRLASALAARGYRLRCLVRNPSRAGQLVTLGAELIVGDITEPAAVTRGMAGASLAYHLAGLYDIGMVDVQALERVNVEGTRVFLAATAAVGLPRAIHVSSTAALGPVQPGKDPGAAVHAGPWPSEYHRTKGEAHHLALAAQAAGRPVIIACPGFVYGSGDEGPSMRYIADLLRHRVPGLSTKPTFFSYVHVDDVVDGLVAVGERGVMGATYVLGGESASVNEFTRLVGRISGTWVSPLRLPPVLVRMTGSLLDRVSRLTGVRMPISRELARVGGSGAREDHSHARAAAELGYAPRGLADGLPETIRDVQERLSQ